jgi:CRISPR-associated protein Cas2
VSEQNIIIYNTDDGKTSETLLAKDGQGKNYTVTFYSLDMILVYDVGETRVVKMLKLCRKYLHRIQNSVFEGEITDVKLKKLVYLSRQIIDADKDSIIIFSSRDEKWLAKEIIGKERSSTDVFL